jgi:peroxiredoxin Q/BCP
MRYTNLMKLAPSFSLPDQDGVTHRIEDYRGRWIVLYFYPKDNTPGCTAEACGFRDENVIISQFGNAAIIGVSKDSVASHKKFAKHHHLNFPLLSDPTHGVIESYGAWQKKRFLGRAYMGIQRSTVIINPMGEIAKVYNKVTPKGHAMQIIEDLHKLQEASGTVQRVAKQAWS